MKHDENNVHETDILVIGGGIGGCFAAIKAKEAGAAQVVQLDKGHVGRSGCSAFAAGIYAAFYPEEDKYDEVFGNLLTVPGPFIVDQERLHNHLETVWFTLNEIESYGAELEKSADGKLERHIGRGKVKNIMFHGPQMMEALSKQARKMGTKQINKTMMTDLLTNDGQVVGAIAFNTLTGDRHIFKAKATILATGGNFYKGRCPGHRNVTGDGLIAAYHAGADIAGLDFALYNAFMARCDIGPGMGMYVGAGGRFVNARGEKFMEKYDPALKDRAALEVLCPAFAMEVRHGNSPIYLDMTHLTSEQIERLKRVIPLPMMMYEKAGLIQNDRFVDKIEWMTYAPVSRGGAMTNSQSETCLPGLYACGDATPWAGAEGGASALPGAVTSGALAGRSATEFIKKIGGVEVDKNQVERLIGLSLRPIQRKGGVEPDHALLAVQEAIMPYDVLLLREEGRMKKALAEIEDIRDNLLPLLCAYDHHYLRMALEVKNIVACAEMQLRSSIFRKESRGGTCLREDYPYRDNVDWLKWVLVRTENEGMKVFTQDIPINRYPVKPTKDRVLDPVWQRAQELGMISIKEEHVVWT